MRSTLKRALLALLVGVVAVAHGAAVGGAHHYPVQYLEIVPADHQPGAENVTYSAFAWRFRTPTEPVNMEVWGNVTIVGPAAGENNCIIARDARAAGIDRGNDNNGTETDDSLIGRFKYIAQYKNDAGQHVLTVQMFDENDVGGQPIHLNHSDEAVAKVANCITNPSTPGWYRWFGYTNGTGFDGEYKEGGTYSHWFYICECTSYDDAVETIGPAPSTGEEDNRTDYFPHDGERGRPTGPFNVTETRANYESSASTTPGGSPNATATPTPEVTPATPAQSPVMSTESTATPTGRAPAGTTSSAATTAASTGPSPGTGASTRTTDGGGAGFGVLVGLLALGLALLARRN